MAMKTSREGLIEIASHEGIVTSPYRDSVGVWTFGIGHTSGAGEPYPKTMQKGVIRPIAEIMDLFAKDVAKYERRVNAAFKKKLTQKQFDAAVSFDFNTGAIHKASWVKDFNAGNPAAAKKSFMNWRKPAEIIPRREKERDLFFKGKYSSGGYANVYSADSSGKVQWAAGRRVQVSKLIDAPTKPTQPDPLDQITLTPDDLKIEPVKPSVGVWAVLIKFIASIFRSKS